MKIRNRSPNILPKIDLKQVFKKQKRKKSSYIEQNSNQKQKYEEYIETHLFQNIKIQLQNLQICYRHKGVSRECLLYFIEKNNKQRDEQNKAKLYMDWCQGREVDLKDQLVMQRFIMRGGEHSCPIYYKFSGYLSAFPENVAQQLTLKIKNFYQSNIKKERNNLLEFCQFLENIVKQQVNLFLSQKTDQNSKLIKTNKQEPKKMLKLKVCENFEQMFEGLKIDITQLITIQKLQRQKANGSFLFIEAQHKRNQQNLRKIIQFQTRMRKAIAFDSSRVRRRGRSVPNKQTLFQQQIKKQINQKIVKPKQQLQQQRLKPRRSLIDCFYSKKQNFPYSEWHNKILDPNYVFNTKSVLKPIVCKSKLKL